MSTNTETATAALEILSTIYDGMNDAELRAAAQLAVDMLGKRGIKIAVVGGQTEIVEAPDDDDDTNIVMPQPVAYTGAPAPAPSVPSVKAGRRPPFWMKRVTHLECSQVNRGAYAIAGTWLREREIPAQPDGTLVLFGKSGETPYYALLEVDPAASVELLGRYKVDGVRCIVDSGSDGDKNPDTRLSGVVGKPLYPIFCELLSRLGVTKAA